ncbi:MAG TPA: hypothetical protein VNB90_14095 [Cytophagaceae bacterium]|nr:hypothetical protein [Cytophagaceae bacterium]
MRKIRVFLFVIVITVLSTICMNAQRGGYHGHPGYYGGFHGGGGAYHYNHSGWAVRPYVGVTTVPFGYYGYYGPDCGYVGYWHQWRCW